MMINIAVTKAMAKLIFLVQKQIFFDTVLRKSRKSRYC